jgi:hypothetical protein
MSTQKPNGKAERGAYAQSGVSRVTRVTWSAEHGCLLLDGQVPQLDSVRGRQQVALEKWQQAHRHNSQERSATTNQWDEF